MSACAALYAGVDAGMTENERYLFDLQGYVVVPNALDAAEVAALNAIVDMQIAALPDGDWSTHRFMEPLTWGAPFRDVIDHPRVLPYVQDIVAPQVRIDHTYLDIIRSGLSPIGARLHGGRVPFDSLQYFNYVEGRFYNGLSVVAINLMDVSHGDGGFGCVPGSHKSNLPFPEAWKDLQDPKPFVDRVAGPAGTAIVFTEALTHGPLPWKGAAERRTLFYKYSPHPVAWMHPYPDGEGVEGLTEQQREMLQPPSSRKSPSPTSRQPRS
jgi:ectoine hydroxylase-related dioxygenase (phytanoyl-CoA dioxygenase family)